MIGVSKRAVVGAEVGISFGLILTYIPTDYPPTLIIDVGHLQLSACEIAEIGTD